MTINRKCLSFCFLAMLSSLIWTGCQEKSPQQAPANDSAPSGLAALNIKIGEDPRNPYLYITRAQWFTDHSQPDSALIDIRHALSIDSLNPAFYITLSDVYQLTGRFPEAEKALLKARAIDPNNVEALVAHARFYLVFKNYDEAIRLANEAIAKKSLNPEAYFVAGLVFLEKNDTVKAIRSLMQATAQDKDYFDAWLRLAMIYDGKQNDLAEGYFKNAIRLRPESQAAWYLLGFFYQENGVYQKAVAAYDSVLRLNPGFREAIYNKGYIAMIIDDDYDRAVELFNQALQVSPGWTDALYNRGYAFELKGEMEKAIADYQEVLKLDPSYKKATDGLKRIR